MFTMPKGARHKYLQYRLFTKRCETKLVPYIISMLPGAEPWGAQSI